MHHACLIGWLPLTPCVTSFTPSIGAFVLVVALALAMCGLSTCPRCVRSPMLNHGTGIDDKKSISGHVLHVFGGPVSWGSHVQPTTSLSTTESEYRAMSEACRESLWLAKITSLFGIDSTPFLVRGDSETAIKSLKNYSQTKYTKHIEIHHEFMKDRYKQGDLDFQHIKGTQNPADIFTKALGKYKFMEFREALGMRPVVE
jgi:hypothetical protein